MFYHIPANKKEIEIIILKIPFIVVRNQFKKDSLELELHKDNINSDLSAGHILPHGVRITDSWAMEEKTKVEVQRGTKVKMPELGFL